MSLYSYKPLAQTDGLDFRSTFSYAGQKKAPNYESHYSAVTIDMPSTDYMSQSQAWTDFFCTSTVKFLSYLLFVMTFPFSALVCLKLAHQYERIILYRLGRLMPLKGPGIVLILPCIDRWNKVDMRTKAFNVPPTRICTVDGCLLLIGGVIHFRVQNPLITNNAVQDMNHSIRVIAQSAMSNHLSKKKLSELMSNRMRYNYDIQVDINDVAREWGLEVGRVELSQPTVEVNPASTGLVNAAAPKSQTPEFGGGDTMAGLAQFAQQFLTTQMNSGKQTEAQVEPDDSSEVTAEGLLNAVHMFLTAQLVNKVNSTYEIRLTGDDEVYYIDLKAGEGSCGKGSLPSGDEPDVTLTMSMSTLRLLLSGKLAPFPAYSSGKLKLQGDMKKAMKLDELIKCLKQ